MSEPSTLSPRFPVPTITPKLPDFQALKQKALKDGKVSEAEAKQLIGAAAQRIRAAVNPGATLEKYAAELDALSQRATGGAKEALQAFSGEDGFAASRSRLTELCDQAVKDLPRFLAANQGKLSYPLSLVVAGSLYRTDDASDADYVRVKVNTKGLKNPDLQKISADLAKAIAGEPKLAHLRGVSFEAE
jgi:hypothetical protein